MCLRGKRTKCCLILVAFATKLIGRGYAEDDVSKSDHRPFRFFRVIRLCGVEDKGAKMMREWTDSMS